MVRGFLAAANLDIGCLGQHTDMGCCKQYSRLLDKFPEDKVFLEEETQITFLDGYVHNKNAVMTENGKDWQQSFAHAMRTDAGRCLQILRGGFCGYTFDKQTAGLTVYTDQVSVKAVYYYVNGNQWMVSNHIPYMTAVLKANRIAYHFNETAAKYMLSYGYMLDDSTFVKEIHRLLPGELARIGDGQIKIENYYRISDREEQMSEEEAVEKIDRAFREAVRREFEKDREYGYRHLVDLSGGLDSRMVSWVAHDMGYTDQLNVTYCRSGYLDEKISKDIAIYLGHEYLFKFLDDISWLYDIDETVSKCNGATFYTAITGGRRLLATLNMEQFGIEHTGMIGDAILSSFYRDKKINYGSPRLGYHKYSERLSYEFPDGITDSYACQEMFAVYTRGILGAQSSYMIRQHYVETASPFMDVDFLNTAFSIPFAYRKDHHIYLKWMEQKYPRVTSFGWEKWGGVKPRENYIFFRKVKTTQRLLWRATCKTLKLQNRDNMNPLDYWYWKSPMIQEYYRCYYLQNENRSEISGELKKDISLMFEEGNVIEKSMALTILSLVNLYF